MAEEMRQLDIVIVGGVACGPKTAATLARRLPDARITVYQKEPHISYSACGLPYLAGGDIANFEELLKMPYGLIRTPEFFKKAKGFDIFTSAEVTSIDRNDKTVTVTMLDTGKTVRHRYDALVLATGATPRRPDFTIPESDRVLPFTRPDDAINFRKLAEQGKIEKALIIGGGFIGCEVTESAAGLWGMETTLVEKDRQLLPYMLDSEMADIVKRELERQGVTVITGGSVEKIENDDNGNPVVYVSGRAPIATDYVFLCLGVVPEVTLARNAALEIGPNGGIIVDEYMRTSDPDIYAGGDCVESTHQITNRKFYISMGSLANRHGRVIAENIAGGSTRFPGVLGTCVVKVFDLNVGSVGLTEQAAKDSGFQPRAVWGTFGDKIEYYPEGKIFCAKMVYDERERLILGVQAAGKGEICRRIDVASALLQHKATLEDALDFEHGYAPPYAEAVDPLHHLAAMAQAQQRGIRFVSPGEDFSAYDGDVIWLDTREPTEVENEPWGAGQVVNIPLCDLRQRIDELDRNKKIMAICKRGPRAYQAAIILDHAGFRDVYIIGGGYQAAYV